MYHERSENYSGSSELEEISVRSNGKVFREEVSFWMDLWAFSLGRNEEAGNSLIEH